MQQLVTVAGLLTVVESHSDLNSCPLKFLVFVVSPLYRDTPETPSNAATALISETQRMLSLISGHTMLVSGHTMMFSNHTMSKSHVSQLG